MIGVLTTIPVDPAHRETAMASITELVEQSKAEDGTVQYHAVEDLTEPNLVRFFELYEDAEAANAHATSEPYRDFINALPEFVDGTIETRQFETDDVSVAEFTAKEAVEALD